MTIVYVIVNTTLPGGCRSPEASILWAQRCLLTSRARLQFSTHPHLSVQGQCCRGERPPPQTSESWAQLHCPKGGLCQLQYVPVVGQAQLSCALAAHALDSAHSQATRRSRCSQSQASSLGHHRHHTRAHPQTNASRRQFCVNEACRMSPIAHVLAGSCIGCAPTATGTRHVIRGWRLVGRLIQGGSHCTQVQARSKDGPGLSTLGMA